MQCLSWYDGKVGAYSIAFLKANRQYRIEWTQAVCHKATIRLNLLAAASLTVLSINALGQALPSIEWRRLGNTALDLNLAGPASGPVSRVRYSVNGDRLQIVTLSGRQWETSDFERWKPVSASAVWDADLAAVAVTPEPGARVKVARNRAGRYYAAGKNAFRSDDGGYNWTNLTQFRTASILGGDLYDLAVSPTDPDELVVAGAKGVWRSLDAGLTWSGLNQDLPNFPVKRIVALPDGATGLRLAVDDAGTEVEWRPAERASWRLVEDSLAAQQVAQRQALSAVLGAGITALTRAGNFVYAGSSDARTWVSSDGGANFLPAVRMADSGVVESFFVDPKDPQFALAALSGPQRAHILRTNNGGRFWDDLSDTLPNASAHAVTSDRATGAIYAATDQGLWLTYADASGAVLPWTLLREGVALDVVLDADGNQIYVAMEGAGVFAALAPHRYRDPRVVSSADMTARAVAPGSLVSIVGREVQSARIGNLSAPVLQANAGQSQIQIPFEVTGSTLSLALDSASGRLNFGLPLQTVSPAVFVDREGGPLVMNADSGLLLDAATPARAGTRLQILATGLGRVRPDWPTGIPAPLENSPRVVAGMKAYLDQQPVEVTRAVLAPGYVGFYLVELQLPSIVNTGTAELYLEADGQQSNRVRIFLEP